MASPAAVVRKPVRAAAGDLSVPAWIPKPWLATPAAFFELMLPCCARHNQAVAACIVGHILREASTADAEGQPWVRISYETLAELAGCSKNSIGNALAWLQPSRNGQRGPALVETRQRGRDIEFRICWSAAADFVAAKDAAAKDADQEPKKQEPKPALVTSNGRLRGGSSKSIRLDDGNGQAARLELVNEDADRELGYKASLLDGGAVRIGVSYPESTDARNHPSALVRSGQDDHTSALVRSVSATLAPIFAERFLRAVEPAEAEKIAARLGQTPVVFYHAFVCRALARKDGRRYRVEPGLFLHLAADAAKAWPQLPEDVRRRYLPQEPEQAAARAHVREDESSGSMWMQIRRWLKHRVSPQDYENWLTATADAGYILERGELRVHVADRITAEFLRQEYSEMVEEAIREISLPVQKVVYQVPKGAG